MNMESIHSKKKWLNYEIIYTAKKDDQAVQLRLYRNILIDVYYYVGDCWQNEY